MFSWGKRHQAKNSVTELTLNKAQIPNHVAIIMDGNGRWAKARHLPRVAGHRQGMENVKTITQAASDLGVKVLTLYAFSTENWKRPNDEVSYLMDLPIKFFNTFVPDLVKNNVQVVVLGDIHRLPAGTQTAVNDAIAATQECTGMKLTFALNYGSRTEITEAVQQLAMKAKAGDLDPAAISEQDIDAALSTSVLGANADPDVLIRTSGEQRISNFLLWQIAYSELVFIDEHWPDFTPASFERALAIYQNRDRRYGGLNTK